MSIKEEIITMAKNTFGLTENSNYAGYLLEDGSMLNFKQDQYSHRRDTEHREIYAVIIEFFEYMETDESIDKFQSITNAIRISQINNKKENSLYVYINIDQNISSKQWRKLRMISKFNNNKYTIYDIISRKEGNLVHLKTGCEESGDPSRDIGKIRLAFNKVKGENK